MNTTTEIEKYIKRINSRLNDGEEWISKMGTREWKSPKLNRKKEKKKMRTA